MSYRPEKISPKSQLSITHFWLRQYPTDATMACIFGLGRRKLTCILRRTLIALSEALRNFLLSPTDTEFERVKEKWNSRLPSFLKILVAIVAGTEVKISGSSDPTKERVSYSLTKKQHLLTLLLICQPDGKIIYASAPLLDSSGQWYWKELNVRDLFENKEFGIIGASGFTFNHKDGEETRNEVRFLEWLLTKNQETET